MESKVNLHAVDDEVRRIKSAVEKLALLGKNIPAIACNTRRIQASLRMLELNISDYVILKEAK